MIDARLYNYLLVQVELEISSLKFEVQQSQDIKDE